MKNKISRRIILVAVVLLTGCSSRPGTGELSAELANLYSCPALEISSVRKDNGREANGGYMVDFSFSLGFKGSEDAAKKFFDQHTDLERKINAKEAEIRSMPDQFGVNLERSHQAEMELIDLNNNRARGLEGCSSLAQAIILGMAGAASQRIQQAQGGPVHIPVAESMRGSALFVKTEKGWVLAAPPNVGFDHFEESSSAVQL